MKYKDSSLAVEERVEDLLSRMTFREKIGQITQVHQNEKVTDEQFKQWIREDKVGSRILAGNAFGGANDQVEEDIIRGNEYQRVAMEETRLGIPIINGRDVIHGHRTVFPINIGMASAWNDELVEKACEVAAKEAAVFGVNWTFAPMLDVARDPRWGRVMEGAGEDPYLASRVAKASVKGFQGDDMSEEGRIAACAKHFIGYGAAEGGRDYNTTEMSDNTLRNTYLPPFKAAVDAGVATVMSGFHELGGEPVSGSKYLLTDVLKDELGFDGFVISDWGSVEQLIKHRVAEDRKEATERAFDAGVDMDMCTDCYWDYIEELVEEDKISMAQVDDAVRRILSIKFKLGLFENPYVDYKKNAGILFCEEHQEAARKLAVESAVLLKNENEALPLNKDLRIALIGPYVDKKRDMLGNWELDGKAKEAWSILDGFKRVAPDAKIITSTDLADDMLRAARNADIVVLCLGESFHASGESSNKAALSLPVGQAELVSMIKRFNKKLVTVILAGRPLAIPEVLEQSDAVLYSWLPGSLGGLAIAQLLMGEENPSGKTPITFPYCTGQVPIYYNHKSNPHGIDAYLGGNDRRPYSDDIGAPLVPFGFGLSYTSFEYSNFSINKEQITEDEKLIVSVDIENTGKVDGYEIAQCYICDLFSQATRPKKELKGYEKVLVKAGEKVNVTFELGKEELGYYNRKGDFVLEKGAFDIYVGKDCLTELKKTIEVI